MDYTIENTTPNPNDPAATEVAAGLMARSSLVRLNPGEVVTIRPGRFSRYGIAYAVSRLTSSEREWLAAYQVAAKAKRRADREAARRARRGQPPA